MFATDPSPAVNVGEYRIIVSALANPNYDISYASGTNRGLLRIVQRPLTVTAQSVSRQYSDSNPTFTGLLQGVVAGDGITASYGTAATASSGIGTYDIVPTLNDPNGKLSNYKVTTNNGTLTVTQEDARAYYTGSSLFFASSTSASSATVTLAATVKDITAVSGDSAYDAQPGNITNAKVTFEIRDSQSNSLVASTSCSNLVPSLVAASDEKVGTVSCQQALNVSSTQGGSIYNVRINVNGYYVDTTAAAETTSITVALPLATSFITGGGYLVPTASAGTYAADARRKTNFGFNVKYNKSGTNLQGNVNVIVRKGAKLYQFKSNALTSLGVQYCKVDGSGNLVGCALAPTSPCTTNASPTCPITATFQGKANLNDVTGATPVSLGGNLTLQMALTDRGEPGSADSLAITVNNGNVLLFSSEWNGTKTVEKILIGGNLAAH